MNLPQVKEYAMLMPAPMYAAIMKLLHIAAIKNPVKINDNASCTITVTFVRTVRPGVHYSEKSVKSKHRPRIRRSAINILLPLT